MNKWCKVVEDICTKNSLPLPKRVAKVVLYKHSNGEISIDCESLDDELFYEYYNSGVYKFTTKDRSVIKIGTTTRGLARKSKRTGKMIRGGSRSGRIGNVVSSKNNTELHVKKTCIPHATKENCYLEFIPTSRIWAYWLENTLITEHKKIFGELPPGNLCTH